MPVLLDVLGLALTGDIVRKLSDQVGGDLASTQKAISAAIPLLIGGLARDANSSQSRAQILERVLSQDHDGSLLDNLDGLLGRSEGGHAMTDVGNGYAGGYTIDRRAADGDGILRHILNDRRAAVENGISRASELDVRKVTLLLPILAVIVMSALGRMKQEQNLDADGLARLLNRERAQVEREAPEMRSGGLMDYLDSDDDGEVIEQVEQISSVFRERSIQERVAGRQPTP
jgi:hypothetical protein